MSLIQCPSCGNMEDIQATICSECGASIAASKKCEECGCPLDSDGTFCPECGCPVKSVSNSVGLPAADNTSGAPAPIQQNIYSPPPAAAAAIAEDPVTAKKRKRFMVYNIIGLLQMIYPTILFWRKLIVIEIDGKAYDFSFNEFSQIVTKVKEVVGLLGSFVGSDSFETLYKHLGYIAEIKIVCYILLLWAAYNFIFGWFNINGGKLLTHCFSISWLYVGVVLIMLVLMQNYFVNPANELLSHFGKEVTCTITSDFLIAVVIAFIGGSFYSMVSLAEGNTVNSRLKTKK